MWADPSGFRYQPGMLYLGRSPKDGTDLGIRTKRHALTFAGSRSGKGVGVIIPNLLRWPQNALVIDPKGEAAAATAEHREKEFGHQVHVLSPFSIDTLKNLPERFFARFNPLDDIAATNMTAREDIRVLADGLVMRSDPRHTFWDSGTVDLLAGFMAHVADRAPPEYRTLGEVRRLLTMGDAQFTELVEEMALNHSFGNLPAAAAARYSRSGTDVKHFLGGAQDNTQWLDSDPIKGVLSDSTFSLSDIKHKPCTVYLVLPPNLLDEHGRFLRLFVRSALNEMAKGGEGGHECLFLLDECYALGPITELVKSAGLLPGMGVKLWPIFQDLNQLIELYGQTAGTFFANADLWQFFAITDKDTLAFVSERFGVKTSDEVNAPPGAPMGPSGVLPAMQQAASYAASKGTDTGRYMTGVLGVAGVLGGIAQAAQQSAHQDAMAAYQHEMSTVGRPRLAPDKIAQLVQLKGDVVADHAICFAYGYENLLVKLRPYFRDIEEKKQIAARAAARELEKKSHLKISAFDFFACGIFFVICIGVLIMTVEGAGFKITDSYLAVLSIVTFAACSTVYFKWLRHKL